MLEKNITISGKLENKSHGSYKKTLDKTRLDHWAAGFKNMYIKEIRDRTRAVLNLI